jgi:hypothetical protein
MMHSMVIQTNGQHLHARAASGLSGRNDCGGICNRRRARDGFIGRTVGRFTHRRLKLAQTGGSAAFP